MDVVRLVAYGLFTGKSWAWLVAVTLSTIGLVVNAISLDILNMGTIADSLEWFYTNYNSDILGGPIRALNSYFR